MINTFNCPKCGEEIEISEAYKHQLEESVRATVSKDEKEKAYKEVEEEKERNRRLNRQIEELLTQMRELKRKDEDREVEMKKRLLDEEEKIKAEVKRKSDEEHKLNDLQKDQKLREALVQIETLKEKIQKGSQQTQGEVLEMEIESRLKTTFPEDVISEIKKGQRGADVLQQVVDKLGRKCGVILWESKNAEWSGGWVSKLKEDMRQAKADIAVLVCVKMPDGLESFGYKDGIWVTSWKLFVQLAWSLRYNLVSLYHERQSSVGKDEKMKVLYEYLVGSEFKNRVEGIVESFTALQEELEKEKRYFNTKWARQEKEIRRVIDHTHGMWGDLQSVIGKRLPEIKSLELSD